VELQVTEDLKVPWVCQELQASLDLQEKQDNQVHKEDPGTPENLADRVVNILRMI